MMIQALCKLLPTERPVRASLPTKGLLQERGSSTATASASQRTLLTCAPRRAQTQESFPVPYRTHGLYSSIFFILALSKSEYAWTLKVALESGFLTHSIHWHFCHIIPATRWMPPYSTPLRVSYCPRRRIQGHPLSGFEGCSQPLNQKKASLWGTARQGDFLQSKVTLPSRWLEFQLPLTHLGSLHYTRRP